MRITLTLKSATSNFAHMIRFGLTFLASFTTICLLKSCGDNGGFSPCIIGESPISEVSHRYDTNYFDPPHHFSIFPKAKVDVMTSSWYGLKVSAQTNVTARLRTLQREDTFYLDFKDCVFRYDQVTATVNGQDIESITLRDSSTLAMDKDYSSEKLNLWLRGAVDGNISGKIGELTVRNSNPSILTHDGENRQLTLNHLGSGDFNAEKALIDSASVVNHGKGNIFLPELQSLIVDILDSGNVYYSGDPEIVSKLIGTGQLIKR